MIKHIKEDEDMIGQGRLDKLDYEIPADKPIVTHTDDGILTRAGAMIEARKKHGDMATIADAIVHLAVWEIGHMEQTVGRGRTWEEALANSRKRVTK